MREYGQVQCSFWQSDDAQSCTDIGRLLALYLITGPHSNGLGCYWLPDGYLSADLGWSSETISKGFEELSRKGFANRFESVVFLPNFLRWNAISNPNVALNRQKEFEALPRGEAKTRVARAMLEFGRHWSKDFETVLQTVCQTLSKGSTEGFAKQDPTRPDPRGPDPTQPEPTASTENRGPPPARVPATPMTKTWEPNAQNRSWLERAGLTAKQQGELVDEFRRWAINAELRKTDKNWQLAFARNPHVKSAVGSAKTAKHANGEDKARRDVLELAKMYRMTQRADEDDAAFAARVKRANDKRLEDIGRGKSS